MVDHIYDSSKDNYDINMYNCGMEACKPSHFFGPAVRDHYLIHYVISGKGLYKYGDKEYGLKKGQGFLICPEKVTYYQADEHDPWTYCWIGFTGHKVEYYLNQAGLSQEAPVFTYDRDDSISDCILEMVKTYEADIWNETKILSLLYLFLSKLIEQNEYQSTVRRAQNTQELYVNKAIEYMEMNYSRKIKITDIAAYIGLDRSYLGALFKEYTGKSLQKFLLEQRIDKACRLMNNNELTISDISRSVGYDDPLHFSKMFKRIKRMSPKMFKSTLK